ncbi:MAG: hypothetical protein QM669_14900 [Siphonobacter sp.]
MKKTLIAGLCLLVTSVFAQDDTPPQTKTFRTKFAGKTVSFRIADASVTIQGYTGNEIIIEAKGIQPLPKEAEGLKPIGSSGADNTGVYLSARTEGDIITFTTSLRQEDLVYSIKIPKTVSLIYKPSKQTFYNGEDLTITGMQGEIEARTESGNINLVDISGPVVAYSSMGKIKAVFSTVNQSKPISLSTSHESIDISLPADTKASLLISAPTGNSFTDFDLLPFPEKDPKEESKNALTIENLQTGQALALAQAHKQAYQAHQQALTQQKVLTSTAKSISTNGIVSTSDNDMVYFNSNSGNGSISFSGFSPYTTKGIINAPGVSITLKSSMGNIYLRKRK